MSRTDAPGSTSTGSTSTGSTSTGSTSTDDIHAGTQAEDDLVRIPAGARGLALAVAGVVLAVVGIVCFTHGQALLVRLPGPIPTMDKLPTDGSADAAKGWMWAGFAGVGLGLLAEIAAGVLGWIAQKAGDTRGIWALVTALGWPLLVVLTVGGIAAS